MSFFFHGNNDNHAENNRFSRRKNSSTLDKSSLLDNLNKKRDQRANEKKLNKSANLIQNLIRRHFHFKQIENKFDSYLLADPISNTIKHLLFVLLTRSKQRLENGIKHFIFSQDEFADSPKLEFAIKIITMCFQMNDLVFLSDSDLEKYFFKNLRQNLYPKLFEFGGFPLVSILLQLYLTNFEEPYKTLLNTYFKNVIIDSSQKLSIRKDIFFKLVTLDDILEDEDFFRNVLVLSEKFDWEPQDFDIIRVNSLRSFILCFNIALQIAFNRDNIFDVLCIVGEIEPERKCKNELFEFFADFDILTQKFIEILKYVNEAEIGYLVWKIIAKTFGLFSIRSNFAFQFLSVNLHVLSIPNLIEQLSYFLDEFETKKFGHYAQTQEIIALLTSSNFICHVLYVKLLLYPDEMLSPYKIYLNKIFSGFLDLIFRLHELQNDFHSSNECGAAFILIKSGIFKLLRAIFSTNIRFEVIEKETVKKYIKKCSSICKNKIMPSILESSNTPKNKQFHLFYNNFPQIISLEIKLYISSQLYNTHWYDNNESVIQVRRGHILEDAFVRFVSPSPIKEFIAIRMVNEYGLVETGQDGGGIFAEFIHKLFLEILNPNFKMFKSNKNGEFFPNLEFCHSNPNFADYCKFFGFFFGHILKSNLRSRGKYVLPFKFALFFLALIAHSTVNFNYLKSYDPTIYSNLVELFKSDDVESYSLDFSLIQKINGKEELIELIPNGKNVPITKQNLNAYISTLSEHLLLEQFKPITNPIKAGLSQVLSLKELKAFSFTEFQKLISGDQMEIDLNDLKANTVYQSGFTENHIVINWLWEILYKSSSEYRQLFLKFCTGTSTPPLLGFGSLDPKFAISKMPKSAKYLPSARTCFNLLFLPEYLSIEQMSEKLASALYANTGFEIE